MKLSELPLCVECGQPPIGPGKGPFYVVRTSLAMVDPRAASGVFGVTQIVSGGRPLSPAALHIAEALAPDAEGFVMIVGDVEPKLMTEFVLCQDCALMGNHRFPVWIEKANYAKAGR